MLSLFPEILFLAPVSILLFRIALALTLSYSAWKHFSRASDATARIVGTLEAIMAVAIIAGAWTQAAGLGASLVLIAELSVPRLRIVALGTALLALVMALSLIVTGAGAFSFDLPL